MTERRRHGWKTLGSKIAYKNSWIRVREDRVTYPDGREGIYGVVEKPAGVCIVPLTARGGVMLLRQYRYTIDRVVWELPAGGISQGETERGAARRELAEEMSLKASKLSRLGNFYTALGHESTEIIAYRAEGLRPLEIPSQAQGDESILEIREFTLPALRRLIASGKLEDGIALASLQLHLNRKA